MGLMDELKKEVEEEEQAYNKYVSLAQRAEAKGMQQIAAILYDIAQDEIKHAEKLKNLYARYELGPKTISPRPFPQTDGEWINLSSNIKDKYSEYDPMKSEVNHQLGIVMSLEEGNVDEAKRWLMQKAGELGVK